MEETKRPEPSNPRIYKIANVNETPRHREKRVKKISDDVKTRLDVLVQYTGATQFPNLVPARIEQKAFIRILEIKGIATENEYEDVYHILIDERIQKMEADKENMRKRVIQLKAQASRKGLTLPPGFKKTGLKIVN